MIMDFREILASQLPPPRADEPEHLRQDILDELNDHLACSYHREILKGADASVARQRVLEQFGDPAALACRLWLDAMRGKIMGQRVLIGTCLIVTLVCLALLGLVWQQSAQAQRMAVEQAALAEARAKDAVERERALVDQMRQMTVAIKNNRSAELNPVTVKITEDSLAGVPVAGVSVELTRQFETPVKKFRRRTDPAGTVDFGSLPPGDYMLQASRIAADVELTTAFELNVQPGKDTNVRVASPRPERHQAAISVRWNWPSDLEKESLLLFAHFGSQSLNSAQGTSWKIRRVATVTDPFSNIIRREYLPPSPSFLCGAKMSEFKDYKGPLLWTIVTGNLEANFTAAAKLGRGDFADALEKDLDDLPPSASPQVDVGTYGLIELIVLRPSRSTDVEPGRKRFDVLAAAATPNLDRRIHIAAHPPVMDAFELIPPDLPIPAWRSLDQNLFRRSTPTIVLPDDYWQRIKDSFTATPGKTNEWTIALPEALITAVREALKADKDPKNKPAAKADATTG